MGAPTPSKGYVFFQWSLRYAKAAVLLHTVSIIGVCLFLVFGPKAVSAVSTPGFVWYEGLFFCVSVYGLILILFSQADAKARFQNYKQAKDLLYENGFDERIVKLFCISRCQRDAVRVAAYDLGMAEAFDSCLKSKGYRWYHLLPDFIFRRPQLLFTVNYWQKTLFAKTYHSRYFLW